MVLTATDLWGHWLKHVGAPDGLAVFIHRRALKNVPLAVLGFPGVLCWLDDL